MDKQAAKKIVVRVVVTFVEGAVAYLAVNGYKLDKLALSGAVAAGLSALYNLGKHYTQ